MFLIEDERHAEPQGEFESLNAAIQELKNRSSIPWNESPNAAPCTNSENCGRSYEIVEYDTTSVPRKEISRALYLEIDSSGAKWHLPIED